MASSSPTGSGSHFSGLKLGLPASSSPFFLLLSVLFESAFLTPPLCSQSRLLQMDQLIAFDAILFPSDGRPPHLVALMTSPMTYPTHYGAYSHQPSRLPHPEHYMSFVADGLGPRAWRYHLVEALDGMNKKFANPYIVFYPTVSRDGMPFPFNRCIREIQGKLFREELGWRGDIIIAKYRDNPFSSMIDTSMADFPILKNYLLTHGAPGHVVTQ